LLFKNRNEIFVVVVVVVGVGVVVMSCFLKLFKVFLSSF
jgi:hypothetical protein